MKGKISNTQEVQFTASRENQSNSNYYVFVIFKPKHFGWLRRLFKLSEHQVETMFSDSKNPNLPKGFTNYKLIGEVKND